MDTRTAVATACRSAGEPTTSELDSDVHHVDDISASIPARSTEGNIVTAMLSTDEIRQRVRHTWPWFHNLDLNGVRTATNAFLGDYPNVKWRRFSSVIPDSLEGKSVLDIAVVNAGFYAMEMKRSRRGPRSWPRYRR